MSSKVVRASLVLIALGLPSVAAADSYHNGGYLNGGYLNGGYLNGGYLNGGYLNGGYLNGGYLNGGYLNGGSIDGMTMGKMKTAQGQTIDNVVVSRDYLSGSAWVWEFDHFGPNFTVVNAWHYRTIEKDEFLNATFDATVNDDSDQLAGYVTAKITSIKTIAGDDGTTHYQHVVKWQDGNSGAWTSLCGCENNNPNCTAPIPATILQGQWNYQQATIDGGKKISNDPNFMTLACAGGAISKCSSDKATQSPLTPSYSGAVSTSAGSWVHKGAWIVYPGEKITVKLTGVSGDPDLYVRWNDTATSSLYNCRPYAGSGVAETCTLTVPSTAYYAYISIYGYGASSSTLTVSATNATPRGMAYLPYGTSSCSYYLGAWHCTTSKTYENQSCTRLVTADYCGDGTPHTVTGRPIEVYDHFNPEVNEISANPVADIFESEWTPNGANSIGTCRVADMDLSPSDPEHCPVYGGTQHAVAHYTMLYNQYGQEIGCAANQSNSGVYTDRDGYLYNYNTGTYTPRVMTRSYSRAGF